MATTSETTPRPSQEFEIGLAPAPRPDCLRDGSELPEDHASKLTLFDAFALLISIQVGSGIFASPAQVNRHTPGPGYAILIWIISGCLAWAGATCYAELGAALPISGGTQEYLNYMYGDGFAFLASWIWILGVKPSGMAALTIVSSQYWINFVFEADAANDAWMYKILALVTFLSIVVCNLFGLEATKYINRIFSGLKILTLMLLYVITIVGVILNLSTGRPDLSRDWYRKNWLDTTNAKWISGLWTGLGESVLSLYAGLWAFSGWDNINIVTGDLQDPKNNLPRTIHITQPVIIISFVLANMCYYMTIPWSTIDNSDAIAIETARNVAGLLGSLTFATLVSLACIGTVSANIYTTSRLVVSATKAGWLPKPLGTSSTVRLTTTLRSLRIGSIDANSIEKDQTPVSAMLFSAGITVIYIITGSFAALVSFIGLAEYMFFIATAVGLIMLRIREPQLLRPYKPNLSVPVIFAVASILLVISGIVKAPAQTLVLGMLVIAGLVRKSSRAQSLWSNLLHRGISTRRGRYEILNENDTIDREG